LQNNSIIAIRRLKYKLFLLFLGSMALTQMRAQHKSLLVLPLTDSISLGSNLVLSDSIGFSSLKGGPLTVDFHLHGLHPRYLIFESPTTDTLRLSFYSIPFQLPKWSNFIAC
jgi:hypothetical protein